MIQRIVEIWFTLGHKPKSFQQNGLLGNRLENPKKPEKLGLEELSIEKLVNWGSIKA